MNVLVYRISSFAVFYNHLLVCLHFYKSDVTRRFILAKSLFSFFCSFRLDTVLDSITLRHDSAAALCWRVPLDLLFLSLR